MCLRCAPSALAPRGCCHAGARRRISTPAFAVRAPSVAPFAADEDPRPRLGKAGPESIRRDIAMTTSAAFTAEEWRSLLEAPPLAGMIVVTASHGGTFKETFAMSKAYADARTA